MALSSLLLGIKVMTKLDSILKGRDITLPTKVCLVKAMVFPVVMYGCESSTIKKAECLKIDAFELWCWSRLLRVPWTARRSNQSILKEISPDWKDWCWSWNSNTLATWFKKLIHGEDPDAGKDWGWEEKGMTEDEMVGWHHRINGHEFQQTLGDGEGQGKTDVLQSVRSQRVRHDWVTEQQTMVTRIYSTSFLDVWRVTGAT